MGSDQMGKGIRPQDVTNVRELAELMADEVARDLMACGGRYISHSQRILMADIIERRLNEAKTR